MATPPISVRPDLGSLRIHDGQRSKSGIGKRIVYAAIPVLLFAGIVVAAFAFRNQKAVVEVAAASRADSAGPQTALNAKIVLARQQVAASEARIGVAQQAVDNCTIRAPFAGIVVSKDAQVGEMVSPISAGGGFTRTGIATIVDMHSNEIEVDVNES